MRKRIPLPVLSKDNKSLLTYSVNEIEIILTPVLHCPNSLASINMPYKDTGQGVKVQVTQKNEFPSK